MTVKIKLACNECGKTYRIAASNTDPECPKCGSVDFDVIGTVVTRKRVSEPAPWSGGPAAYGIGGAR